jgi:ABC-type amino acid transport substrate-binding protein
MPIGDQLNSRQSAEFAELASQIRIHQFNHLAESRLQRDAELIASAAAVIEKLREGDSDGLASEDPNGHGLALIYLLRVAIEKDEQTLTGPPDAPTCSLDSALSRGQQAAYASVNRLLNSSEAHQLDVLRKRYAASDQLNPETLPSPDREKAIWLTKAVVEPSGREAVAVTDYENLRRFARVSALRYQEQRDAIISGAGSEKYDYGSGLRKLYSDADDLTKHTLNVWLLIDEKVPSTAAIEDQQKLEILRKASGVEKSK